MSPQDREAILKRLRELAPVLRARGLVRVELFGSVARGEGRLDSDIDLLVELSRPMGFEFFELQDFLTKELGAQVELSTRDGMRPRVRIEAEKNLVRVV